MKRLTPSKSPTDTDRAIRDDRKSDLAKVLDYVGPDGVDFVGFTNEGVTRAHPTVTRHVTREQLVEQIRTRQGEQLRWLIDLSHVLRWWANRPGQVERGEKDQVVVIFEDEYVLDFRDSPKGLRLTKLRMLRDPDGGD